MIHILKKYKIEIILSFLIVIILNILVKNFIIDDAYISFRYSENFLKTSKLYYNQNEEGPFGYTNPLYIFIISLLNFFTYKNV